MGRSAGEGNGSSLQCSCLENPGDGGAWRAPARGGADNQTRLKRLSTRAQGLGSCGPQALELGLGSCGSVTLWHVGFLGTRDWTCAPALQAGFLTTASPGTPPRWSRAGKVPCCIWVRLGQGSLPRTRALGSKTVLPRHLPRGSVPPPGTARETEWLGCFPSRETSILPHVTLPPPLLHPEPRCRHASLLGVLSGGSSCVVVSADAAARRGPSLSPLAPGPQPLQAPGLEQRGW